MPKDLLDYYNQIGINHMKEAMRNNPKLHFDEVRKVFSKKKKYNIDNRTELLNLVKNTPAGILENEDLYSSYPFLKEELALLKQQKQVRYLEVGKKVIIFSKDEVYDKDCENLPKIMKEKWKETIKNLHNYLVREKVEDYSKMLKNDKKKKKNQRKSRRNVIFNDWMKDEIDFSEVVKANAQEEERNSSNKRLKNNRMKFNFMK